MKTEIQIEVEKFIGYYHEEGAYDKKQSVELVEEILREIIMGEWTHDEFFLIKENRFLEKNYPEFYKGMKEYYKKSEQTEHEVEFETFNPINGYSTRTIIDENFSCFEDSDFLKEAIEFVIKEIDFPIFV